MKTIVLFCLLLVSGSIFSEDYFRVWNNSTYPEKLMYIGGLRDGILIAKELADDLFIQSKQNT